MTITDEIKNLKLELAVIGVELAAAAGDTTADHAERRDAATALDARLSRIDGAVAELERRAIAAASRRGGRR